MSSLPEPYNGHWQARIMSAGLAQQISFFHVEVYSANKVYSFASQHAILRIRQMCILPVFVLAPCLNFQHRAGWLLLALAHPYSYCCPLAGAAVQWNN